MRNRHPTWTVMLYNYCVDDAIFISDTSNLNMYYIRFIVITYFQRLRYPVFHNFFSDNMDSIIECKVLLTLITIFPNTFIQKSWYLIVISAIASSNKPNWAVSFKIIFIQKFLLISLSKVTAMCALIKTDFYIRTFNQLGSLARGFLSAR